MIQTIAQAEFWRTELLLHPEKSLEKVIAEHSLDWQSQMQELGLESFTEVA
ncbi:MAG: hypothetical protein ACFUZC_19575 [Chthoniobacteraceae bacterium]